MRVGGLPEDGAGVEISGVTLPPGRRVVPVDGRPGVPVAWVTRSLVAAPGLAWAGLSAAGLVPVLIKDEDDTEDYCFYEPRELAEADRLEAGTVLATRWRDEMPDDDYLAYYPQAAEAFAPFSRQFPGLAAAQRDSLEDATLRRALNALPPARIGLIAAGRPADALPVAGWAPFDDYRDYGPYESVPPPVWIAAVLRSWETRFGASLLTVGPGAEISLLVRRPPDAEAAALVAAEHYAFADECDGCGSVSTVGNIAARLPASPVWQFWWD
jgi:hypothetical protein